MESNARPRRRAFVVLPPRTNETAQAAVCEAMASRRKVFTLAGRSLFRKATSPGAAHGCPELSAAGRTPGRLIAKDPC
jgi:hypothetical protein